MKTLRESLERAVIRGAALSALLMTAAVGSGAEPDAAIIEPYLQHTLFCQDTVNHAACRIILLADRRYEVHYRLGRQDRMPEADGPFENESRTGTYTVGRVGQQWLVCLQPAPVSIALQIESRHEFFANEACYPLSDHRPGDRWSQQWLGRRFDFWLVEGR